MSRMLAKLFFIIAVLAVFTLAACDNGYGDYEYATNGTNGADLEANNDDGFEADNNDTLGAEEDGSDDMATAENGVVRHLRVAAVGDSTTFGSGAANPATDSYPAQLAAMFAAADTGDTTWEVMNFGVGGTTVQRDGVNSGRPAAYRDTQNFADSKNFNPDIVLFMLGTNDSKTINRVPGVEAFMRDYIELVNELRNQSSAPRVYIMTPVALVEANLNQWLHEFIGGTEFIAEVTAAIKEFAVAEGLPLIDINEITSRYPDFIADGVHPNAAGYRVIAEAVFAVLYEDIIARS